MKKNPCEIPLVRFHRENKKKPFILLINPCRADIHVLSTFKTQEPLQWQTVLGVRSFMIRPRSESDKSSRGQTSIEVCFFCYSGNFNPQALGIIAEMFNKSADPQGWFENILFRPYSCIRGAFQVDRHRST
jgi:hypothetical protein